MVKGEIPVLEKLESSRIETSAVVAGRHARENLRASQRIRIVMYVRSYWEMIYRQTNREDRRRVEANQQTSR